MEAKRQWLILRSVFVSLEVFVDEEGGVVDDKLLLLESRRSMRFFFAFDTLLTRYDEHHTRTRYYINQLNHMNNRRDRK